MGATQQLAEGAADTSATKAHPAGDGMTPVTQIERDVAMHAGVGAHPNERKSFDAIGELRDVIAFEAISKTGDHEAIDLRDDMKAHPGGDVTSYPGGDVTPYSGGDVSCYPGGDAIAHPRGDGKTSGSATPSPTAHIWI